MNRVRAWEINKKVKQQPVVIDFKNKTLEYDGKKFWIRFETQDRLYVYSLDKDQHKT
jgi:hypothetical protein